MAEQTLEDVGHGQVRHVALAGEVVDGRLLTHRQPHGLERPRDVAVREHDALGRAGRARGVDDRGDVVERCGAGVGVQVGGGRRRQIAVADDGVARQFGILQQHDVLQGRQRRAHLQEPLQEGIVLDDGNLRLAVVDEVLDLLGRRRVVDRHRRGAEEERGEVERVELGAVLEHEHDRVALADAQTRETRDQACRDLGQLGHGP